MILINLINESIPVPDLNYPTVVKGLSIILDSFVTNESIILTYRAIVNTFLYNDNVRQHR